MLLEYIIPRHIVRNIILEHFRISMTEESARDDIQGIFALFSQSSNQISKNDLKAILQTLHLSPTENQTKEIRCDEILSLKDVSEIYESHKQQFAKRNADQLINTLAMFDEDNTGLLSISDFRLAMMSLGEKFSVDEFDSLMRTSHVELVGDKFLIEEFVARITK